jgi:hypothetical protein
VGFGRVQEVAVDLKTAAEDRGSGFYGDASGLAVAPESGLRAYVDSATVDGFGLKFAQNLDAEAGTDTKPGVEASASADDDASAGFEPGEHQLVFNHDILNPNALVARRAGEHGGGVGNPKRRGTVQAPDHAGERLGH